MVFILFLLGQIHWPVTGRSGPTLQPPYIDTWSAMEAAADSGLVRSIGVSNLSAKKLEMLLRSCRIKPAVNQARVVVTVCGGGRGVIEHTKLQLHGIVVPGRVPSLLPQRRSRKLLQTAWHPCDRLRPSGIP